MRLITIIYFLLFYSATYGQIYFKNPFEGNYFDPHAEIGVRFLANGEDALLGFGAGLNDVGFDYNVGLEFAFRPVDKYVFIEEDESVFYQYDENLRYLSLYAGKRFDLVGFGEKSAKGGVYTGFQLGYLWGNYKGVRSYENDKGYVSPELALYYTAKNAYFSVGYSYFDTPSDEYNHMVNIRLTYTFNRNAL
jgi:hypothetical protein